MLLTHRGRASNTTLGCKCLRSACTRKRPASKDKARCTLSRPTFRFPCPCRDPSERTHQRNRRVQSLSLGARVVSIFLQTYHSLGARILHLVRTRHAHGPHGGHSARPSLSLHVCPEAALRSHELVGTHVVHVCRGISKSFAFFLPSRSSAI